MIDNNKIIAARVAARMDEPTDLPVCNSEDFYTSHKGVEHIDRKWREFEITCKSTNDMVDLAIHHTQKIHNDIENILERPPFNGGRSFWQNDRAVCSWIENLPDQILDRLAPVFVAFDRLDPDHQVRKHFESTRIEFEAQVAAVQNQFPGGKGVYKKRLKELTPIGEEYLHEYFDVTGKLIGDTFQSKPW